MAASRVRALRVYDLHIEYPPGSHEPGWFPFGWDLEYDGPFRWPKERRFLGHRAAYLRKKQLEGWGARVVVMPSNPVTWPVSAAAADDATLRDDVAAQLRAHVEDLKAAHAREMAELRARHADEVRGWEALYDGERALAERYRRELMAHGIEPVRAVA